MAFKSCCNNPNNCEYIIPHDSKFNDDINDILLECLWELPELPSYQANHNTVFSNDVYDDFFIDILKSELGLSDDDIDIVTANQGIIDDSIAEYYENEICLNCSKLVFHKRPKETKIAAFFNHLRNMIAHGCFNIVCGIFIGFDHPKYDGKHWTAVLKTPYKNIKKTVDYFVGTVDVYDIYERCLKEMGYLTVRDISNAYLYVEKDENKYMLFIKSYEGRYAQTSDIDEFVKEYEYIDKTSCMFVLIIDSTYATKEIQSYLAGQNIAIIDKSSLKKMMQGTDVLKDLLELRKI